MKTRTSNQKLNRLVGTMVFLFCFISLFILSFSAKAAQQELRISPLRFGGVHNLKGIDNQNHGFMVLETGTSGNWNYNVFDNGLNPIYSGHMDLPRYAFFNQLTSNGKYTLVNFLVNAFNPSITYILLNENGIEVARQTREKPDMLRRGAQFFPQLYNHPDQGFIVTQGKGSGRKTTYTVEHLNNNLKTVWTTSFNPTNGNAHVYDIHISNDHVYILEATESWGRTRSLRLHCLYAFDGAHVYTMELTNKTHSFFPTAFRADNEGNISLSGTYFNGERINSKKARGIFFMSIDPQGNNTVMSQYAWKDLRGSFRTSVPDWFFKVMPEIYMHAMESMPDGSYRVIGELFRYSGQYSHYDEEKLKERYHRIRLLDFMFLTFNAQGDLLLTERIEKPHSILKLDSEFTGPSGSLAEAAGSGTLRRARAMKKAGAFSYRFHQMDQQDDIKLGFTTYENKMHYAYIIHTSNADSGIKTALTHALPKAISYLQIIDLCYGQSGFGFILTELNTRSFDDSEAYWRGAFHAENGQMMYFEYMPLTSKLKLNLMTL